MSTAEAETWLEQFRELQRTGESNKFPKIQLKEIVEKANHGDGFSDLRGLSPRSCETFMRCGVDPAELVFYPEDAFHDEDPDVKKIKYEYANEVRLQKISKLQEVYVQLVNAGDDWRTATIHSPRRGSGTAMSTLGGGSDMVEKERKRLEVSKRRQQQNLQQMVQYEVTRKQIQEKAQEKFRAIEMRIEEQKADRLRREAEWREAQRERELKKKQEEEEREAQLRAVEAERYQAEIERAKKEAAEEKQRRREAYMKEQERIQKAEQARKETERILAEQEAAVMRKKQEMDARDREREAAMQRAKEERSKQNEEARRKAAERLNKTLEESQAILERRRLDFEERERKAEERRKERERQRLEEERMKKELEKQRAAEQRRKFEDAKRIEQSRVSDILHKASVKEEKLQKVALDREHDLKIRKAIRDLDLELKREKVQAHQRKEAYRREQTLQRILDDTDRAMALKAAKEALQAQRRQANLNASMQRYAILQEMEKLQIKGVKEGTNLDSITTNVFNPSG